MSWTRVESDAFGGSGDQSINDIAIGGPGLVAVGADGSGGDLDAAAQGGRYASPEVAALLSWMENNGAAGVGQSSWGPTGFAICENRAVAASLCERARTLGLVGENLELQVSAARNRGAEIHADDKPAERVREPATGATPGA